VLSGFAVQDSFFVLSPFLFRWVKSRFTAVSPSIARTLLGPYTHYFKTFPFQFARTLPRCPLLESFFPPPSPRADNFFFFGLDILLFGSPHGAFEDETVFPPMCGFSRFAPFFLQWKLQLSDEVRCFLFFRIPTFVCSEDFLSFPFFSPACPSSG